MGAVCDEAIGVVGVEVADVRIETVGAISVRAVSALGIGALR